MRRLQAAKMATLFNLRNALVALLSTGLLAKVDKATKARLKAQAWKLPCNNFRQVLAPSGSGCLKRIPAPTSPEEVTRSYHELRQIWENGPYDKYTSKRDWKEIKPGANAPLPIRVGLTASITGQYSDPDASAAMFKALTDWAGNIPRMRQLRLTSGWRFCFAVCLHDDRSNRQRAVRLYKALADNTSGYDVDVLLGPATFDFRNDAARVANTYQKPMLQWSYPRHLRTLGIGASRDPNLHQNNRFNPAHQNWTSYWASTFLTRREMFSTMVHQLQEGKVTEGLQLFDSSETAVNFGWPSSAESACSGPCNASTCCQEMYIDVDGHSWTEGRRHVFDMTVPPSDWAFDALRRLHGKGARRIVGVVTSVRESHTYALCNHTIQWARQLGYESPYTPPQPVLLNPTNTLNSILDIGLKDPDVLLLCGDTVTINNFLLAMQALSFSPKSIVAAYPLGNSRFNVMNGERVNFLLEPLPWPSLEWIVQTFGGVFHQWADRYAVDGGSVDFTSIQIIAVAQLFVRMATSSNLQQEGSMSLNTTRVEEFLSSLGPDTGGVDTFMGNIRFQASGKRQGGQVGTRQYHPLPTKQASNPGQGWQYWQARRVTSEAWIVVDDLNSTNDLLEVAANTILMDEKKLWKYVMMGLLGDTVQQREIQTPLILDAVPGQDFFQELRYPIPTWREKQKEVYPCPHGCIANSFACQACPPGRSRSEEEELCIECPSHRPSDHYGAVTCPPCPDGAICDGSSAWAPAAQQGFWRGRYLDVSPVPQTEAMCSEGSGFFPEDVQQIREVPRYFFLKCSPEWLCLGGNGSACYGGNTGLLCRSCKPGYYSFKQWDPGFPYCKECPPLAEAWLFMVLMVLYFGAMVLVLSLTAAHGAKIHSSIVNPIIREVCHYLVILSAISETLHLDRHSNFMSWSDIVTRPFELMHPDCLFVSHKELLGPWGPTRKLRLEMLFTVACTLVGWGVILGVFLVRSLCFRVRSRSRFSRKADAGCLPPLCSRRRRPAGGPNNIYRRMIRGQAVDMMRADAVRQAISWTMLALPMVVRMGGVVLACKDLPAGSQSPHLMTHVEVACDTEEFLHVIYPLAVGTAVSATLLAMLVLGYWLYRRRNDTHDTHCRTLFGPLILGYKPRLFWYELVWLLQLAAVMLTKHWVLTVPAILLLFEILKNSTEPYVIHDRESLMRISSASFKVNLVNFICGWAIDLPERLPSTSCEEDSRASYLYLGARHSVSIVTFLQVINSGFMLYCASCMIFNAVLLPTKTAVNNGRQQPQPPWIIQMFLWLASAHYGLHHVVVNKTDSHFSMNVNNLRDGERDFLMTGITEILRASLKNCGMLSVSDTMQALRYALARVTEGHRSHYLVHEQTTTLKRWRERRQPKRLGQPKRLSRRQKSSSLGIEHTVLVDELGPAVTLLSRDLVEHHPTTMQIGHEHEGDNPSSPLHHGRPDEPKHRQDGAKPGPRKSSAMSAFQPGSFNAWRQDLKEWNTTTILLSKDPRVSSAHGRGLLAGTEGSSVRVDDLAAAREDAQIFEEMHRTALLRRWILEARAEVEELRARVAQQTAAGSGSLSPDLVEEDHDARRDLGPEQLSLLQNASREEPHKQAHPTTWGTMQESFQQAMMGTLTPWNLGFPEASTRQASLAGQSIFDRATNWFGASQQEQGRQPLPPPAGPPPTGPQRVLFQPTKNWAPPSASAASEPMAER